MILVKFKKNLKNMLVHAKPRRLDEALIRLLGLKPQQTADTLWRSVQTLTKKCTPQAVYYELKKLMERGIIVKSGQAYSLNLLWLVELSNLCDEMSGIYMQRGTSVIDLPDEENRKTTWNFRNLLRADEFRLHVRLNLFEQTNQKLSLCVYPHLLFPLLRGERIKEFGEALRSSRRKVYCAVGSRSRLDTESMTSLNPASFTISNSRGPFTFEAKRYLEVIGDYLLEVTLDSQLTELTERLFRTSSGIRGVSHADLIEVLRANGRVKLSLSYSPTRTRKLKKQFQDFFGIRNDEINHR